MSWLIPPETAPQDRVFMAFPCKGATLGRTSVAHEAGHAAWAAVAHAIADRQRVYPRRRIVPADARAPFARDGGIRCITRQQPKPPATPLTKPRP